MDIFEELLEKTKGFPPEHLRDIQGTAETLQVIGALSKSDLIQSTSYILDHLPELRMQRAQALSPYQKNRDQVLQLSGPVADGKPAKSYIPPLHMRSPDVFDESGLRVLDDGQARRLARSAESLANPRVSEQYKNRAALVELSLRLKAHLRDYAHTMPELDPVRLKKFNMSIGAVTKSMPGNSAESETGPRLGSPPANRELMARLVFIQHLREADGDVALAVDNFYKDTFSDIERGHWADEGIEKTDVDGEVTAAFTNIDDLNLKTPSPQQDWEDRQDTREHAEAVAANVVLQNMPKLAAEHLNPKEYAAYRVMIDNEHLIDWKIEKDGKLRFRAQSLDATDPENTIGKILMRDLNYQNIRGANLLIENTVSKLNGIMRERGSEEVTLTERAAARIQKSTPEITADPAAQARPAPTLGKPRGNGKDKGRGVGI